MARNLFGEDRQIDTDAGGLGTVNVPTLSSSPVQVWKSLGGTLASPPPKPPEPVYKVEPQPNPQRVELPTWLGGVASPAPAPKRPPEGFTYTIPPNEIPSTFAVTKGITEVEGAPASGGQPVASFPKAATPRTVKRGAFLQFLVDLRVSFLGR